MASKRTRTVFFPWERRSFLPRGGAVSRVLLALAALLFLCGLIGLRAREERAAAVRATRARILDTYRAISSYRADHSGNCPKQLGDLETGGYLHAVPVDAWGRPLRVTCPGRRDPAGFEVASDGPDGLPYGLDRVE